METRETIPFTPTENYDSMRQEMREWLQANLWLLLQPIYQERLSNKEGGSFYLDLGGYFPHPTWPGKELHVEAALTVDSPMEDHLDPVDDPDGTTWYRNTLRARVNWPSCGAMDVPVARMRAHIIELVLDAAERFNQRFAGRVIWTKGMTKVEKAKIHAEGLKRQTHSALVTAVKAAIHTTCRGMRVESEREIGTPKLQSGERAVPGSYVLELENKSYVAIVYDDVSEPIMAGRTTFRRST